MKKNVIKIVCFLIILTTSVLLVQHYFMPFGEHDTNQTLSFYELEEDSVDVLFVGTSLMMMGVSPLKIYDSTGISSYNRACSVQFPQITYLTVKETLKTQHPKVVMCSAISVINSFNYDKWEPWLRRGMDYKKLSVDKLEIAEDIVERSSNQTLSSYVMPLLRYHSRWSELITEGYDERYGDYDYLRGMTAVYKHKYIEDRSHINLQNMEKATITKDISYWLKKTIKLCKKNDIEFVIVGNKMNRWTGGMHNTVQKFADENNVDFLDYNLPPLVNTCDLDWETDYCDRKHTNVNGTLKFSETLGQVLQEKYRLKPSRISDDAKKQYEKDINRFKKDCRRGLKDGTAITW